MKNRSLREPWAIIIIAMLLVAAILIVGNQSFKATEKATFDEFNQRQLVLATEAAGGIELYFEALAGDMRALARIPEVQHFGEAPTRQEMQHTFDKLQPLGVNDVAVLNGDGVLQYNVEARQIEGTDFSWRRYYQEARRMTSSENYIIEFIEFKGVEVGQRGVLVAVPMFETGTDEDYPAPSGKFAGVVLCTLRLDTITQKFVASVNSSERGHAILIDDEYNVLWAPDGALFGRNLLEEGEGFPTFQQIVRGMTAGRSGVGEYSYYRFEDSTGEYSTDKKEEKLVAYTPIRLGNELWAIGVWAPKEDARQLIRAAYLRQLFVVGLCVMTILVAASYSLARLQESYGQVAQERDTQAERLEIMGKLAASLAHEINNPLQAVIGCLGLAEETLAEGGDASPYLQVGHQELRRVASIVAQLRDLQRRSLPQEREFTDVNALLQRVLMLSKKRCEDRQVEVLWRRASDLPSLLLVPDRVQQVLLNLLVNAIDAMPEGGRLQVSMSPTKRPDGVRISFTDNGVGIAADVLPHIFDPFYSTKREGLGLGLFISQNIVEDHGGHIEVESQAGTGATFTVWLPA